MSQKYNFAGKIRCFCTIGVIYFEKIKQNLLNSLFEDIAIEFYYFLIKYKIKNSMRRFSVRIKANFA